MENRTPDLRIANAMCFCVLTLYLLAVLHFLYRESIFTELRITVESHTSKSRAIILKFFFFNLP